ncbi:septum formation family protein [Actinokineospora sp. G85]|uniref:septum formation family protein n=1 Tax=Actinokineospora sp. G85 TaxID=3406626 RepID=UPI003C71D5A6
MAGALAGSMLLLISSMLFSWPVATGGGVAPTPEEQREAAFEAPTGSCLAWTPPDGQDIRVVDCAASHLFEVTSTVDITADYPENAPAPDVAAWQEIAVAKCTPGATTYLGGTLDPFGRYSVNALKPNDTQWAEGDRKLRCGLQSVAPSGALQPTTGPAAKQDQSNIHEPGTCLALDGQKIGDPIDCAQPHAFEIVGNVDLAEAFPAEYPNVDQQTEKALELCTAVATTYTGGADLAAKKLTLYSDTLKEESWAAGSRQVDCKVGAKLPGGGGLAPITNSVRATPAPAETQPPATTPGG